MSVVDTVRVMPHCLSRLAFFPAAGDGRWVMSKSAPPAV